MVKRNIPSGQRHVIRPQCMGGDIVAIDGMSCSGKSLLAPLISTLKRSELWQINYLYDYICTLNSLGLIEHRSAEGLIRTMCDLDVYNSMVARNINLRPNDISGATRNLLRSVYLKRLEMPDGDIVLERIRKGKPILPLMLHSLFAQSQLLFDALRDRLKLYIVTVRHPFWLFDAWHLGRWDKRETKDPRLFRLCCQIRGKTVPWFAVSWADEYHRLKPIDLSVKVTAHFIRTFQERQRSYPTNFKRKVYFVPFEKFSQAPLPYLDRIAARLHTSKTAMTKIMMKKLCLPRTFRKDDIQQKRAEMVSLFKKEGGSRQSWMLLEKLASDYESTYLRT